MLDLKKLRSEILIVSQEIALFDGTILENLNPVYIQNRKNRKEKKKRKGEKQKYYEEKLIMEEGNKVDEEFEK